MAASIRFSSMPGAELKPLYNRMEKLPSLQGQPLPILPEKHVRRTSGSLSSMDLGRGCPYQCSFCTIINVQGQKSRFRSADDVERIIRENYAQGIRRFFITDDNFARNRDWEALFDRMIMLRSGKRMNIGFTIQVDTLCHRIPNFIEKAAKAGVRRVFIGLENINPDNLIAAKKRQNKITEYREMLQKWREHGAITCAGYIIGFPGDSKASILRDIEIIKRELPLDILEFFFLTPLPGSEDHKVLWQKGAWMALDLNQYDLHHRVSHHSKMSDEEWEDSYKAAWEAFYNPEHVRTILRRTAASRLGRPKTTLTTLLWFKLVSSFEHVHPLEGGALRMKHRRDRRYGLPLENRFIFYPRYFAETTLKAWHYWRTYKQYKAMFDGAMSAPDRSTYTDLAIARQENELDNLELYHATDGGEAAVSRKRRDDAIRLSNSASTSEHCGSRRLNERLCRYDVRTRGWGGGAARQTAQPARRTTPGVATTLRVIDARRCRLGWASPVGRCRARAECREGRRADRGSLVLPGPSPAGPKPPGGMVTTLRYLLLLSFGLGSAIGSMPCSRSRPRRTASRSLISASVISRASRNCPGSLV